MSHSTRFAREAEGAAAVVVSRQPILDNVERIVGFELLTPPEAHPHEATASVLAQAIADIGLHRLVGERPAHVDVTREFLVLVSPLPLDPARVVLELPSDEHADAELVAVLREARDAGFRIALDSFRAGRADDALLDLAESVKIDVAGRSEEEIEADVNAARGRGLAVIANGVPTRAVYGFCRGLGFDAFQGQYFAEPVIVQGASVPTYRLRALSMLAAGEAATFEQLERVIAEDPGLSLKLVKLANSAFYGGRHPVGTIRQALMALGTATVRRWAALLALAGVNDRPSHLLETGLLRARLCELVAARTAGAEAERGFTVGLFSVVDSLMGMRMPDLLGELPFDERTTRALGAHEGPEGKVLAGVLAYEAGEFDKCVQTGVSLVDIAHAYGEALDWTDGALVQLSN
ncbi:HDOD domain-containing protein [Solirubrobacter sp. CPCC 204708]|uniref:HDOD domain-containing protein n=1 Tax=Solirubrobacter deserti TaxID=2282478 RepID=A0ABT4RHL2_9ACTN|nr:HDOD domain-containing protein [Solirubrobacter deserti]MBE2316485.1 HDOD domain-containing protein [Solirubrobacter deserti]MDA0138018.1 HDOD domain-containing protein [Solirubrobacter deserti]